jgi:hypothetical protein
MEAQDRLEVREMITDIIGAPLEKIEGQYRLISSQLVGIDIQTTKTNNRINKAEVKIDEIQLQIAKGFPHTIAECPQVTTIEDLKIKYNNLKTAGGAVVSFKDTLRSNIGVFLVGVGVVITLTIGLINLHRNKIVAKALDIQTIQENKNK